MIPGCMCVWGQTGRQRSLGITAGVLSLCGVHAEHSSRCHSINSNSSPSFQIHPQFLNPPPSFQIHSPTNVQIYRQLVSKSCRPVSKSCRICFQIRAAEFPNPGRDQFPNPALSFQIQLPISVQIQSWFPNPSFNQGSHSVTKSLRYPHPPVCPKLKVDNHLSGPRTSGTPKRSINFQLGARGIELLLIMSDLNETKVVFGIAAASIFVKCNSV